MKGLQRYEKENKFIDWMKQSDSINDCKKKNKPFLQYQV